MRHSAFKSIFATILFLAGASSGLAQQPPAAEKECIDKLDSIAKSIETAESEASMGQLAKCVKVEDQKMIPAHFAQEAKSIAEAYQAAQGKYLKSRESLDSIEKSLAKDGGNICGATAEVKTEVKALQEKLGTIAWDIHITMRRQFAAEKDFNKHYGDKWFPVISIKKTKTPESCRNTKFSIADLKKQYLAARKKCGDMRRGGVDSSFSAVSQLRKSLDSGCDQKQNISK